MLLFVIILLLVVVIIVTMMRVNRHRRRHREHFDNFDNNQYITGTPYLRDTDEEMGAYDQYNSYKINPDAQPNYPLPVRYDINYPSTLPASNKMFISLD